MHMYMGDSYFKYREMFKAQLESLLNPPTSLKQKGLTPDDKLQRFPSGLVVTAGHALGLQEWPQGGTPFAQSTMILRIRVYHCDNTTVCSSIAMERLGRKWGQPPSAGGANSKGAHPSAGQSGLRVTK